MLHAVVETLVYKDPTLSPTSRARKLEASASAAGRFRLIALGHKLDHGQGSVSHISHLFFDLSTIIAASAVRDSGHGGRVGG